MQWGLGGALDGEHDIAIQSAMWKCKRCGSANPGDAFACDSCACAKETSSDLRRSIKLETQPQVGHAVADDATTTARCVPTSTSSSTKAADISLADIWQLKSATVRQLSPGNRGPSNAEAVPAAPAAHRLVSTTAGTGSAKAGPPVAGGSTRSVVETHPKTVPKNRPTSPPSPTSGPSTRSRLGASSPHGSRAMAETESECSLRGRALAPVAGARLQSPLATSSQCCGSARRLASPKAVSVGSQLLSQGASATTERRPAANPQPAERFRKSPSPVPVRPGGLVDAAGAAPKGTVPCPHCARNFFPESLAVHQKSCGGAHGTSKVARSALEGASRQQRDTAAALHLLLQATKKDDKLPAKIRACFNKLDVDHNGHLDANELEMVCRIVDLPPPSPSIDKLVAKFDQNQDGNIQYAEFERLMRWIISHH